MAFIYKNTADTANNILMIRLDGFIASVETYLEWEQDFLNIWHEHFGNGRIKILSDQRGFKPTSPEVIERVSQLRLRMKPQTIANAIIVDNAVTKIQLKRLAQKTGFHEIDEFFIDSDEGLRWLKQQR